MNETTTIKISLENKKVLDSFKEYKRESYSETIEKMINIIKLFRKDKEEGIKEMKKIQDNIERYKLARERYNRK